MKEEIIGSCVLIEDDDEGFSLVFAEFEDKENNPTDIAELLGSYEAGGHEWALIISAALKLGEVELEGVSYDPESDMFSASCKKKKPLEKIAQTINNLLNNKSFLNQSVKHAIKLETEKPAIDIEVNENGWVKCPKCRYQFKITDRDTWSGKRHISCGQALNIINQ